MCPTLHTLLAVSSEFTNQPVDQSNRVSTAPLCWSNCVFVQAVRLHYSIQDPVSTLLCSLGLLGLNKVGNKHHLHLAMLIPAILMRWSKKKK